MIEVVADTGCDEDSPVFDGQLAEQTTQVNKAVHHLSDAETVAEVVERVVPVVLLHTQLHTQTQAPSGESLRKIRCMHTLQASTCSFVTKTEALEDTDALPLPKI